MNAKLLHVQQSLVRGNGSVRPQNGTRLLRATNANDRVRVDGRFFRVGTEKLWVKGVTYGPFKPTSAGLHLPDMPQIESDFAQLQELGANTIRVYHAPPQWMLDKAAEHGLKVLVDTPFAKNRLFLDSKKVLKAGREAVRRDIRSCQRHPAVLAYIVANEIPPDVVRWLGHNRVERYLDELADIAKQEDPEGLVTFASYPPTEYLHPQAVDFYTMNVYLHSREKFRAYLQRLQNQTDDKPLLLGEYGIDTIREGEEEQARLVTMHVEEVFHAGLAGSCVFSFTDEWFTNDCDITDWAFGLVRRDRSPKPVCQPLAKRWCANPLPNLERYPRVSVVVCSYNGASTLEGCLQSLGKLNYPDYEVILVDDGSTDATREIAQRYPNVRYHYQRNKGLSVARNVGMDLASGEIIAYTDSDCMADEDWLYFLVSKLLQSGASAVGGPNLLPTNDGPVAACISASPGTPAHILLDDEVAEHVPGCNMAFWANRLRAIGGFDPIYTKAGDDVDVCWRLQQQGEKIVFSPAGMVWHHRRSTVRAYLKQQIGYGEAEALLKRKHPDKFRGFRSESVWAGRIYTRAGLELNVGKSVIHHGQFATGMFQTIYSPPRVWWPLVCLSLEWWLAIFLLLGAAMVFHPTILVFPKQPPMPPEEAWLDAFADMIASQASNPLWLMPSLMFVTPFCVSYLIAGQARPAKHHRRWWSRLLIAAMHILQPLERGFARYRMRFRTIRIPEPVRELRRAWEHRAGWLLRRRRLDLWSDQGVGREKLLAALVALAKRNRWNIRVDSGWDPHDITFYGDRWCKIDLITATDNHGGNKLLTSVRLRLRATLFYNAVVFALWYVLVLGFFAKRDLGASVEYDITQPSRMLMDWVANNRWELALIPVLLAILLHLRILWWQLNRTVMASILSVAEELGATIVGAPNLLRRHMEETERLELQAAVAEPPIGAVVAESAPPQAVVPLLATGQPPAATPQPILGLQPAPVPPAPVLPGPPVTA